MHEMGIAQGILDIAMDHATRHDVPQEGKIKVIHLLIGEMTGVEPESLRFCFSSLAAGTIAENAELKVAILPLLGRCRNCQREFSIDEYKFVCPACASVAVEIISGRELKVECLEVE